MRPQRHAPIAAATKIRLRPSKFQEYGWSMAALKPASSALAGRDPHHLDFMRFSGNRASIFARERRHIFSAKLFRLI